MNLVADFKKCVMTDRDLTPISMPIFRSMREPCPDTVPSRYSLVTTQAKGLHSHTSAAAGTPTLL
jgi:hypothetical protein